MMRRTQYPAYADHKEDHETLLDDLRDIMDDVEDDGVLDESQLTDDLDRWFSDHFKTHDAKLHRSGRH
jgi:hemerythrin